MPGLRPGYLPVIENEPKGMIQKDKKIKKDSSRAVGCSEYLVQAMHRVSG